MRKDSHGRQQRKFKKLDCLKIYELFFKTSNIHQILIFCVRWIWEDRQEMWHNNHWSMLSLKHSAVDSQRAESQLMESITCDPISQPLSKLWTVTDHRLVSSEPSFTLHLLFLCPAMCPYMRTYIQPSVSATFTLSLLPF